MPAMKSGARDNVRPDIDVTTHAKLGLAISLSIFVAVSTVILELSVCFNYGARHDQGFQSKGAQHHRSGAQ
jgi:hypothetical protein